MTGARSARRVLGPLSPLVAFFSAGLVLLFLSRLALTLAYLHRVAAVPDAWHLFPIGLRIDVMTLSIALFLPTPAMLILPERGGGLWKPVVAAYFALVAGVLVVAELSTGPFLAEYDSRPNRIFVDYLAYPHGTSRAPSS